MQDETNALIDNIRDAEGSMDEKCHKIRSEGRFCD